MGLAMRGLTHCEKCGQALNYDEYVLCKYCEEEENKKSNEEENKKSNEEENKKSNEEENKKSNIEIKRCEYCEDQKYLSNDLLYSTRIQEFEDKNKKRIYMLVINSSTYIRINYCPICGRKL